MQNGFQLMPERLFEPLNLLLFVICFGPILWLGIKFCRTPNTQQAKNRQAALILAVAVLVALSIIMFSPNRRAYWAGVLGLTDNYNQYNRVPRDPYADYAPNSTYVYPTPTPVAQLTQCWDGRQWVWCYR